MFAIDDGISTVLAAVLEPRKVIRFAANMSGNKSITYSSHIILKNPELPVAVAEEPPPPLPAPKLPVAAAELFAFNPTPYKLAPPPPPA
jgi:hypothetical protein